MILGKMLLPLPGTTLKNGLVSCWEFDEASGAAINDSFGSNNLAVVGTYLANQSGKLGAAYSLAPGYAYRSNKILSAFPFSFSWWIKMNSGSANRIATNVSGANYYGVEIGLDYNQCMVQFGNGAGSGSANRKSYQLSGSITTGVWHHVVVVFTGHGSFTFYLDNVVKSGFSASGTATSTSFAAGGPYVGKNWGAGVSYASCICDQVAFWNRALSAPEVASLYNSGDGLPFAQW
jgi:hypothetical protein